MDQPNPLSKYVGLTVEQLIQLLEKRDRSKKLGLIWERDEIEADSAVDANFIACTIDADLSEKPAPWRNLVVEGDNFDALRWLRIGFSGRIKCIYIDPPYNTGNKDWVYNDRYFDASDRYRHSTWLEFLFRRLTLARDLLSEDGVLLVSINDENRARLELLLDEALPGMRLGTLTWRSRTGGNEGGAAFLSDNHEHILIYGRPGFRFAGTEKSFEKYDKEDEGGIYRKSDLTQAKTYKERANSYFPIHDVATDIWYPCNPDAVWRFTSRSTAKRGSRVRTKYIEDWLKEERILFPEEARYQIFKTRDELVTALSAGKLPMSGRAPLIREGITDLDFWVGKRIGFGTPAFKRYAKELRNPTQPLSSWVTPQSEESTVAEGQNVIVSGTNDEAAKSIKDVFGTKAFNYAKPVSLLRKLIGQASSPGDIVLDFFAGSASTAHAVMELNAEGLGDRRFIMVSSTEATEEEPDKNLCRDVCAQRIRLLNASTDKKFDALAAGFAYLRTREIQFEDLDYEITPSEAWAILETIHDLPLTVYDADKGWNEHTADGMTLIYADRVDEDLIRHLQDLAAERCRAFVYAWAPGQLSALADVGDIEIRSVHDVLMQRFQQ